MLQEALCRAARTGPVPDQLLPGRLHRWATVVLAACAGVTAGLGMAFAGDHGPGRLDSALDHPFLSVPHEAPTRIIRVSEIGNEVPTFTATALLVLRAQPGPDHQPSAPGISGVGSARKGARRSSSPESPRLGSRHRNTVRQIFEHPVSHNGPDDWPLLGELASPAQTEPPGDPGGTSRCCLTAEFRPRPS